MTPSSFRLLLRTVKTIFQNFPKGMPNPTTAFVLTENIQRQPQLELGKWKPRMKRNKQPKASQESHTPEMQPLQPWLLQDA